MAAQTSGTTPTLPSVPPEWKGHIVAQAYDRYDIGDQELWRDLVADTERTLACHAAAIHPAYHDGFGRLVQPWRSIPKLADIDAILAEFGWRTASVDGYIPADVYAGLMTRGIFPVSRNLRRRDHMAFSPVPDMAHDLFGHVPMLVSAEYRHYLRRVSRAMSLARGNCWDAELYEANRAMATLRCQAAPPAAALRAAEERVCRVQAMLKEEPSTLTELGRLYLWTTEFGLIGDRNAFHVYGAGLLSSMSELELIASGGAEIVPFSEAVFSEDIRFSDPQRRYFVAPSFAALDDALTTYLETHPC